MAENTSPNMEENPAYKKLKAILSRDDIFCPMCHNNRFRTVPGFITQLIQESDSQYVLRNNGMVPCISVVCDACGFLSQHVISVLDSEN